MRPILLITAVSITAAVIGLLAGAGCGRQSAAPAAPPAGSTRSYRETVKTPTAVQAVKVTGRIVIQPQSPTGNPLAVTAEFRGTEIPLLAEGAWKIDNVLSGAEFKLEKTFRKPATYHLTFTLTDQGREIGAFGSDVDLGLDYCRGRYAAEAERIRGLAASGDFAAAHDAILAIVTWGIPELLPDIQDLKKEVDSVLAPMETFYGEIFTCFDPQSESFNYGRATGYMRAYIDAPDRTALEKGIAESEFARVRSLLRVYEYLLREFRSMAGDPFVLGGVKTVIRGAGSQVVVFQSLEGREIETPVYRLQGSELAPLLAAVREHLSEYQYGAWLEYTCRFKEAAESYRRAKDPGRDNALAVVAVKEKLYAAWISRNAAGPETQGDAAARAQELAWRQIQHIAYDLTAVQLARTVTGFRADAPEAFYKQQAAGRKQEAGRVMEVYRKEREEAQRAYRDFGTDMDARCAKLKAETRDLGSWSASALGAYIDLLQVEANRFKKTAGSYTGLEQELRRLLLFRGSYGYLYKQDPQILTGLTARYPEAALNAVYKKIKLEGLLDEASFAQKRYRTE